MLRDVSIHLPTSCNIGILGRNGMGKSTLLRLLGGIDYPNRGRIKTTEGISWPMGLQGGVQGSFSGCDNTRFACRIYGDSEQEVERKIKFVLDFSELDNCFDMPLKNALSQGCDTAPRRQDTDPAGSSDEKSSTVDQHYPYPLTDRRGNQGCSHPVVSQEWYLCQSV
jgi:hypothetical protein